MLQGMNPESAAKLHPTCCFWSLAADAVGSLVSTLIRLSDVVTARYQLLLLPQFWWMPKKRNSPFTCLVNEDKEEGGDGPVYLSAVSPWCTRIQLHSSLGQCPF